MSIKEKIESILEGVPQEVRLVAVSKTHPAAMIREAYDAGQRIFGENKVQEMTAKSQLLPPNIEWHFIGHVQRNKIRQMAPYVSVIQGIDSFESLVETNRQAARYNRNITCYLQIHIATEETKFGFTPDECTAMLENGEWRVLDHITIGGLMGMASNTGNEEQVLGEFRKLTELFNTYRQKFFKESPHFNTISAGMSGDYRLAIEAGSNMIRVGSAIFGERDYSTNN